MSARRKPRISSISRRGLLKGLASGAAVLPFASLGRPVRAQIEGAKRVVFVFIPDGVQVDHFWPTVGAGGAMEFSPTSSLLPLMPHLADLTVVRGLEHRSTFDRTDDYHGYGMRHVMTAGPDSDPLTVGGITSNGGISIDQFLGQHLGGSTPFSHYAFGVRSQFGYQVQRELSFSGTDNGTEAQANPAIALEELFGGTWDPGYSYPDSPECGMLAGGGTAEPPMEGPSPELIRRRHLIGLLQGEVGGLRCEVGGQGARHLDAHVAALVAAERQLADVGGGPVRGLAPLDGELFACLESNARGYTGYREWFPKVSLAQIELLTAALAQNRTRVALLQYGHTNNSMEFAHLPIAENLRFQIQHSVAHQQADADTEAGREACKEAIRQITTWYMEQVAHLVTRLKSVDAPEGGTLFDHTAVVVFSEMSYGATHNARNIPTLILGNAEGAFRSGQYVELPESRPFADLLLTVSHGMGVPADRFGETSISDARGGGTLTGVTGPITELLG